MKKLCTILLVPLPLSEMESPKTTKRLADALRPRLSSTSRTAALGAPFMSYLLTAPHIHLIDARLNIWQPMQTLQQPGAPTEAMYIPRFVQTPGVLEHVEGPGGPPIKGETPYGLSVASFSRPIATGSLHNSHDRFCHFNCRPCTGTHLHILEQPRVNRGLWQYVPPRNRLYLRARPPFFLLWPLTASGRTPRQLRPHGMYISEGLQGFKAFGRGLLQLLAAEAPCCCHVPASFNTDRPFHRGEH